MSCHVGFGNQVQIVSLVAITFTHQAISPAQHWNLIFFYFKIFYFSSSPRPASIKGVEVNNWPGCWGAWAVLCPCRQEICSFPCQLGKCPSDTSSIPEASFELIPLPITGFSVGQPEMAPKSESSNGFNNAQGKMSSREESTLHSCSGKWGQWRSWERIFFLPTSVKNLLCAGCDSGYLELLWYYLDLGASFHGA